MDRWDTVFTFVGLVYRVFKRGLPLHSHTFYGYTSCDCVNNSRYLLCCMFISFVVHFIVVSFLMVLFCRGHYRCSVGRCTTLGYLCMWVFRRCDGRRIMGRWIVWSASMGRTRVVYSRSRRSSASARADAAGVGLIVWPCVAAWGFDRARCGRDKTCLCGTVGHCGCFGANR